ncbi:MAG: universal stress protein [Reichenbachiella sp.]
MSNILVPIDFSETSKTATRLAIEWSKLFHCNVILVHNYRLILDHKNANKSPRAAREGIVSEKLKQIDKFEKEVNFNNAHSLTTKLELGFTIDSIKRMTAEGQIDLIIYGVKSLDVPHSTNDLLKILESQLAPVLIIHGNHVIDNTEPFEQLDNKIISVGYKNFKEHIDSHLATLDNAPNLSYLIHPISNPELQISSSNSSIAERIVNFRKAN